MNNAGNFFSVVAYDGNRENYQMGWQFPKREEITRGVVPNFRFDRRMNYLTEVLGLLYLGMMPNMIGGFCNVHIEVYLGNTIMNEDGALVHPSKPDRVSDIQGTISFDVVLRLSRHLDIAAVNVVFLAMRTMAEIRSQLQTERYADGFGEGDLREGFSVQFLRASGLHPTSVWESSVRAGDVETGRKVGLLYKNAPCWGLQLSYGTFWNMLQIKEQTLYSPKSEFNCFMLAFYHAQAKTHPANMSKRQLSRIGNRARQAMRRYREAYEDGEIEGEMYSVKAMSAYLASSVRKPPFNVWSMRGVLLFTHLPEMANPVEIAVAYGHAFAFVNLPNLDGKTLQEIKKIRQKFPNLPAPHNLFARQNSKKFLKKREFKNEFRLCVLDLETTMSGSLYATGFYEFSEEALRGEWSDAELDRCVLFNGSDSLMKFFDYMLENFEKGPKYVIFAHFGGGFDFLYYVREALRHQAQGDSVSYFSKCLEVQGSIIKLRHILKRGTSKMIRKNYLNIILRDSFPLLRASLDRLSKSFKPPHPKLPDLVHHELVTDDNWEDSYFEGGERYLKHDLLSLAEILQIFRSKMQQLFEIDPIESVTLPSLSRTVFMRKYYQPADYPLCTLAPEFNSFLRKAYYGGRVEAHQLGVIEGPIYYFDVTSEYPFAMLQSLPYGEPVHLPHGAHGRIPYGLLRVRVRGGWKDRPNLFPVRGEDGLIYPYFELPYEMYVWSEEVQFSVDNRFPYTFEIIEAWEFNQAPYYRKCIDDLYRIKRDAESPVERQIGKDLVNSGYGIWGMKVENVNKIVLETATRFNPSPINKYLETMTLKRSNVMENTHFMKVSTNLDNCVTYLPLAVAVTAKARIHLFSLMNDIIEAGGKVYYTDTDSVITNIDIGDPQYGIQYWRENENEMGQVKVEFDEEPISRPEVVILGSKFYAFPPSAYSERPDEAEYEAKLTLKGFYKKFRWGFMTRDEEAKEIHFKLPTQMEERGPHQLNYSHFLDMANGWVLKHDVQRLVSKTRGWINNQCNVSREEMTIQFKMNYKKGKVEDDLSVTPWKWDSIKFY